MADQTTKRMTIAAPPERVWRALVDFERYHEWAPDLKEASVVGDPNGTDVTYNLAVELVLPLPGFVKRRAEARIIHTALEELKDYLESGESGESGEKASA